MGVVEIRLDPKNKGYKALMKPWIMHKPNQIRTLESFGRSGRHLTRTCSAVTGDLSNGLLSDVQGQFQSPSRKLQHRSTKQGTPRIRCGVLLALLQTNLNKATNSQKKERHAVQFSKKSGAGFRSVPFEPKSRRCTLHTPWTNELKRPDVHTPLPKKGYIPLVKWLGNHGSQGL